MDFLSLIEGGTLCLPFLLLAVLMPVVVPSESRPMPIGFTESDFQFAKYLKCLQTVGCQTIRDIVRAMYSQRCMRTRNGTMTIRHFNMRANVDPSYVGFEFYLDSNIMEEDFDISFGNKILNQNQILGAAYNSDFSEKFRERISYIVHERNKICHMYGDIKDFKSHISILKICIEDIYSEANTVLNRNFSSREASNILDSIERATVTDLVDWEKDLADFQETLRFKLLNGALHELKDYYGKLKTLNPCTWIDCSNSSSLIFDLERVFTPPRIWDDKYRGDLPMEELFTAKMKRETVPNVLLLKGLAGSGKTSLCRYLLHSWINNTEDIQTLGKFDLVLLIDVRRTCSNDIFTYLKEELMKNACREFKGDDIMPILEELDVLFIVDGYDERSDVASELVKDIFENFPDKRTIITTRPDYEDDLASIAKIHKKKMLSLTLQGFNDSDQQKTYSRKVFEMANRNCDGFLLYLDGRGRVLDEHLKLPLTLSLLIVLWMESPKIVNKITTATSLYHEIFNLYQDKLVERLIVNLKGRRAGQLKLQIERLLLFLGELAWDSLQKGFGCDLSSSSRNVLERKCIDCKVDNVEFLSAFLVCEMDDSLPNSAAVGRQSFHSSNMKYYFIHKTQMEYLAAEYLSECIRSKETNVSQINGDWKHHSEVLIYLIGNMAKRNILKNSERDIINLARKTGADYFDYCFWWKVLSESHIAANIPVSPDKPICYTEVKHPLIAKMIYNEHLSESTDWKLDASNVAAGLRLMSLVNPMQLVATTLVINLLKEYDPARIPDFYDALSSVKFHWDQKSKKNVVEVELHLYNHDCVHRSDKSSDDYLSALSGWAVLKNFTGCLSRITHFSPYRDLKTFRCMVKSPNVLKSFKKLPHSLRRLRVTLGFDPEICKPEDLDEITFKGDLELFIPFMKNHHLSWIMETVQQLARGDLFKLHLERSELTIESITRLARNMKGTLKDTLSVTVPDGLSYRERERANKKFESEFNIDWLD